MALEFEPGNYKIPAPTSEEDVGAQYVQVVDARGDAAIDDFLNTPLVPEATPKEPTPEGQGEGQSVVDVLNKVAMPSGGEKPSEGGGVKGVLKDMAKGATEAPLQIVGGFMDAINEAGEFLQDVTGIGGLQIMNDDGEFDLDYLTAEEWKAEGKEDALIAMLTPDDADSATGGFVRATAQFLTGFIPAVKGAKALGVGAKIAPFAAGAIADAVVFDPHEDRLSTFLNEVPMLEPYVSDYLADNNPDNESEWEGRLKNAIEGAGLGIAADGATALIKAFKYYKAQRVAGQQFAPGDLVGAKAEAARDQLQAAAREEFVQDVPDEALRPLGDPEGDLVTVETAAQAEKRLAEARSRAVSDGLNPMDVTEPTEPSVYINHSRINEPEDVQAVIQQLADADAKAINEKRGGEVVTNAETVEASKAEYTELEDLLGRDPGPMTAAKAVASRKILAASASQVAELARRATSAEATPADIYNFRRATAVHYAIQTEVIAARSETARALQAWAIPVEGGPTRSAAISDLIMKNGGASEIQGLARAIASVDDPTAINVMARELGKGRFGKSLYQVWINGLLSSPKTHAVNILSNAMVAVWAIPERYLAAGISKHVYDGQISTGEVSAQAFGLVKGVRDGARLVIAGNKAAGMDGLGDVFDAFAKSEIHNRDISAEAFGLDPAGAFGSGIDMMGKVINAPGSMLAVEDKFFKSIGYRMELNALAYRTANSEGLEGEEFAARVSDILNDPPDNLKADALDAAHYQTFTKELGSIGKSFQKAVQRIPGMKLVVPFIRTPTNILKYTFERTPLAYMSSAIRADIKAGGARASQAQARVAMGTMAMLITADMTSEGTVTGRGPSDHKLRSLKMATGWKPYSIKVGDRWYEYSRTDPIGMIIGLSADISELSMNANDEDTEIMATAAALALANNLANKTYMSGLYDFIGAIDPSNPTNDPGKYLADFTGSFMPFSSFIRNTTNAIDPIVRDTTAVVRGEDGQVDEVASYFEELLNRQRKLIPGYSDDLPPRRDLFGEEINRSSELGIGYDFVSPIASRIDNPDAVVQVMLDNKVSINQAPRTVNGVQLTAEEYSDFVEMAGKPMKEYLDKLIPSEGFQRLSNGPDGMKAEVIKDVVRQFREQAKGELIRKYPHLVQMAFQNQMRLNQATTGN